MHLGVNLCVAQVKAASKLTSTNVLTDQLACDGQENQEDIVSSGRSASQTWLL